MKRITLILSIPLSLLALTVNAGPSGWPKLENGNNISQCIETLEVARGVFQSEAFYIYAPPNIPTTLGSILVLQPEGLNISGGDALQADQSAFNKVPIGDGISRSIYWQQEARYGMRLVVGEFPSGWRGDTYAVFFIHKEITLEHFLEEFRKDSGRPGYHPIAEGWRSPFIFKEKQSGDAWFIDVGATAQSLDDWQIYSPTAEGMKLRCTVRFHPPIPKVSRLLPAPVRKLEILLNNTMGSGANEGTLQQTARLRIYVEDTWINVALRPWSLAEPYNSRKEVDMGLLQWSQQRKNNKKSYQDIQTLYPVARRSLAEYYRKNFHRPAKDSQSLAAYVLDIAFRSHYTFHSEFEDRNSRSINPPPNPWASKKTIAQ